MRRKRSIPPSKGPLLLLFLFVVLVYSKIPFAAQLRSLDYVELDWRHVFEDCVEIDARNATSFPPLSSTVRGQTTRDSFSSRVAFCAVANMRCYTKTFHGGDDAQPVRSTDRDSRPIFFSSDTYELRHDTTAGVSSETRLRVNVSASRALDPSIPRPSSIIERPCRISSFFAGCPGANGFYALLAGARERERKSLPPTAIHAVEVNANLSDYQNFFRRFGLDRFVKGTFGVWMTADMPDNELKKAFCPDGPLDWIENDAGPHPPISLFLRVWRACRPRYWHHLNSHRSTSVNATLQGSMYALAPLIQKQLQMRNLGFYSDVLNKTGERPLIKCSFTEGMVNKHRTRDWAETNYYLTLADSRRQTDNCKTYYQTFLPWFDEMDASCGPNCFGAAPILQIVGADDRRLRKSEIKDTAVVSRGSTDTADRRNLSWREQDQRAKPSTVPFFPVRHISSKRKPTNSWRDGFHPHYLQGEEAEKRHRLHSQTASAAEELAETRRILQLAIASLEHVRGEGPTWPATVPADVEHSLRRGGRGSAAKNDGSVVDVGSRTRAGAVKMRTTSTTGGASDTTLSVLRDLQKRVDLELSNIGKSWDELRPSSGDYPFRSETTKEFVFGRLTAQQITASVQDTNSVTELPSFELAWQQPTIGEPQQRLVDPTPPFFGEFDRWLFSPRPQDWSGSENKQQFYAKPDWDNKIINLALKYTPVLYKEYLHQYDAYWDRYFSVYRLYGERVADDDDPAVLDTGAMVLLTH